MNTESKSPESKSDSTQRFTGLAASYSRGRPSYPDAAVDFIIEKCSLTTESLLVDVGCGTGISSRLFAARGIRVIGVEPNSDMLKQAREYCANAADLCGGTHFATLQYLEGTAENTNLSASAVDSVLCAQAFHWFHPEKSISEFCRILKPAGWIALMWNERNESDPFTKDYGDLLRSFPETSKVEMHRGKAGEVLRENYLVRNFSVRWFDNEQIMDFEGFQDRAFSASYVPKEPPLKEEVRAGLERLFARYNVGGSLAMQYRTSVYLAQRK
jgi:SAM-dependent methyltransferase